VLFLWIGKDQKLINRKHSYHMVEVDEQLYGCHLKKAFRCLPLNK
jgi:hypothetical protein